MNEIDTIVGEPLVPFDTLTRKMFSLFDRSGFMPSIFESKVASYPYDHYIVTDEKTDKVKQQVIQIPVAGYFKNEIHVSVKNDNLRVEMIPEAKADNTNKKYVHCGIKKGKVCLEWFIKGIKSDKVKTSIGNGMLTITIDDCNPESEYIELELE